MCVKIGFELVSCQTVPADGYHDESLAQDRIGLYCSRVKAEQHVPQNERLLTDEEYKQWLHHDDLSDGYYVRERLLIMPDARSRKWYVISAEPDEARFSE